MPTKISGPIKTVVADKKVTVDEWKALKEQLDKAPKKASAEARAILSMLCDDKLEFEDGVRSAMRAALASSGYQLPADTELKPSQIRATLGDNVTEVDKDFETLLRATGRKDALTTIAVIDSGFEVEHPALADKLWTNAKEVAGNSVDDDGNGLVDDIHGWDYVDNDGNLSGGDHGSHVSGIATRGNAHVKEIALRGFDPLDPANIVKAIDYAAANGALVVNMSFRVRTEDGVNQIKACMERHPEMVFVKSAGNDGERLDPEDGYYGPKSYLPTNVIENMLVVASADPDGKRADYSNYGAPFATVAARGSKVFSSVPGGRYEEMDGTSMASPNVAAICAKCLALNPSLKPVDLKRILVMTTDRREDWKDLAFSGGLVNQQRATRLAALLALTDGGLKPEEAAKKLSLRGQEGATLLMMLKEFRESPPALPTPSPRTVLTPATPATPAAPTDPVVPGTPVSPAVPSEPATPAPADPSQPA